MLLFLLKRLVSALLLVAVLTSVTFLLMSLLGNDPARIILGELATDEQVRRKTIELGLDRPLLLRYSEWFTSAIQGDFGRSWQYSAPVKDIILQRLPVSLSLIAVSTLLTATISVVIGLVAAVKKGVVDKLLQVFAVVWFALPNFWLAVVLVSVFSISLGILPATGYVPFEQSPVKWAIALILPVGALIAGTIASTAQQVRGATIEVLNKDFVRTLKSRGISSTSLVLRHVLRNSAAPALTVLSLQFIGLLGGAVVIEKVFALPGLGSLIVSASVGGDLPQVLGIVVTMVLMVVVVNLIIDILIGWLNPKVRI